jgi:hypothetical protein
LPDHVTPCSAIGHSTTYRFAVYCSSRQPPSQSGELVVLAPFWHGSGTCVIALHGLSSPGFIERSAALPVSRVHAPGVGTVVRCSLGCACSTQQLLGCPGASWQHFSCNCILGCKGRASQPSLTSSTTSSCGQSRAAWHVGTGGTGLRQATTAGTRVRGSQPCWNTDTVLRCVSSSGGGVARRCV